MSYAEVAVNSPMAGRRTFCYAVPNNMQLSVGHTVWVPFGPRILQGVVCETTEQPSVDDTREVAGLIAPDPIIFPHQVKLARWVSEYYLAPLFDVMSMMLPPGFSRRMLTFIDLMPYPADSAVSKLNPPQRALLDLVGEKGRVEVKEVEKAMGRKEAKAVIDQLVRRKLIRKTQQLERGRVKPKTVPYVRLTVEATQELARLLKARGAPKQARLLRMLESGPITVSEARKQLGNTASVVAALERKGLVTVDEVQVYRDPLEHRNFNPSLVPELTLRQDAAWREIKAAITLKHSLSQRYPESPPEAKVFLLHGVSGSGKTEIYLRALEETISIGKRAIVLVPEIALTPQTIDRFASRFPGRVAVLHSRLSLGEQFDEWRRIREGAFDVVIGSRSAIFAPQPDLGLIVVDEEHEWTYKQQEQAPRYHARDVAVQLAGLTGSVVILGSATPDVATYHKARAGEYRLLELPQRIGTGEKRVEVVDLREELKAGNRSIFSRSLTGGIKQSLAAKEQVILFLNRRGSATFVQCRDCGYVPRCKRCDVSLTYHSVSDKLACHQCNYRVKLPRLCPQCGSKRIKFLGIGTQKVEEEVGSTFPQARLLRWDRDATGGKHSHEEILDKFIAHKADILIGTQMIAKGLDLPLVTLVGIINADVSLHLPDFRAGERTFQILSQVAGRAGRSSLPGRVVLQSYTPEHYAIDCVANYDYGHFYEQELSLRREYANPPFSHLARLVYTNANNTLCHREAQRLSRLIKEERDSWGMDIDIIGPAPSFFSRVRGRYRWQVILRGADLHGLLERVPLTRGWIVDIDPVSVL
jgi:primosomal protein N' (replication factor Y)